MAIVNMIAFILVLIGAINWGLIGLFRFNLITAICGEKRNFLTVLIYTLVFLAAIWLIISAFIMGGILPLVIR